ncbi:hypothetical protein Btru_004128 [Bulinus truncatus]|nr:hypothetical protein Btru_004128 [Bulinus truncatus]
MKTLNIPVTSISVLGIDGINNEREVIIDDIKAEDFEIILKYASTGVMELTSQNAASLLLAADYLKIEFIRINCIKHMSSYLTIQNVCSVINFSSRHKIQNLLISATKFLKKNVDAVSRNAAFSSLEPYFLVELFKDDNLLLFHQNIFLKPIAAEKLILEAVLRYISMREPEVKKEDVVLLLSTVRWPMLNQMAVERCLQDFPLFKYRDTVDSLVRPATDSGGEETFSNPEIKELKQNWFKQRNLSMCLYSTKVRYAETKHLFPVCNKVDYNNEIKKVDIWIRTWDGRPVIAKIQLSFRNIKHEEPLDDYSKGQNTEIHESFKLKKGENITKVVVKSGKIIDSLYFETNLNRTFGPFGGPGGTAYEEKGKDGKCSYLYDICCNSAMTQGSTALYDLILRWVTLD